MFSKRHYEKIARAIQEAHAMITAKENLEGQQDLHDGADYVRDELADMFARDNGQFKRDRFDRACVDHAAYKEKFYYD
jgi:hypothetical protein